MNTRFPGNSQIKGAELRKNATRGDSNQRRHAIGFLDRIFGLLRHYEVGLVARIWVKGIGAKFDATPVYTSSIQGICTYFEHHLTETNDVGLCIADSRNKFKNVRVSLSIFTQKFSLAVQRYERLTELPTFGHSEKPRRPSTLRHCLFRVALSHCLFRILHGTCEQRPCSTACRPTQRPLRTAAKGSPISVREFRYWPLRRRARRI